MRSRLATGLSRFGAGYKISARSTSGRSGKGQLQVDKSTRQEYKYESEKPKTDQVIAD